MVRGACHCTAVRFTVEPDPVWVNDCNCSICRRYGALWAYTLKGEASILQGADATETYIWGDRELAFHRCRTCGCVTHHVALENAGRVRGVNARLLVGFDPKSVRIRRTDNAHTGFFWSREDDPIVDGPQPPTPRQLDDWR
jgi:hypothetical protein